MICSVMIFMAMAMGKKDLIHKTLPKQTNYISYSAKGPCNKRKTLFFVLNMVPPPPPRKKQLKVSQWLSQTSQPSFVLVCLVLPCPPTNPRLILQGGFELHF